MEGLVIRNTGSWYVVRTDDGQLHECKVKGNFRLRGIRTTNPVAVGDRVRIGGGFITDILDRKNYIIRRASNLSKQSHIIAANIDMAFLVVTVSHPATSTTFIDRFLAGAEAYRVPVTIVVNKVDLLEEGDMDEWRSIYEPLGYHIIATSAITGEGIDELGQSLTGISLFSGNSGVGKSSLLQALIPGLKLRTAEISEAHDTGMHTTTFSEMFEVADGWVIDTPGIKGFGTFNMEREEVSHYFREIFDRSQDCRFNPCTHTHEPGCAVQAAVAAGEIAASRYNSYIGMLDDKDEGKYRT